MCVRSPWNLPNCLVKELLSEALILTGSMFQDLPTLDELKIDVDPKVVLMEVGAVQSVIGPIGRYNP